jgi:hypothetical protein
MIFPTSELDPEIEALIACIDESTGDDDRGNTHALQPGSGQASTTIGPLPQPPSLSERYKAAMERRERAGTSTRLPEAPPACEAGVLDPETEAMINRIGAFIDEDYSTSDGGDEVVSAPWVGPASYDRPTGPERNNLPSPGLDHTVRDTLSSITLGEKAHDRILETLTMGEFPPEADIHLAEGRFARRGKRDAGGGEIDTILAGINTTGAGIKLSMTAETERATDPVSTEQRRAAESAVPSSDKPSLKLSEQLKGMIERRIKSLSI